MRDINACFFCATKSNHDSSRTKAVGFFRNHLSDFAILKNNALKFKAIDNS